MLCAIVPELAFRPESQCAIAIKTHGSKDSRQAEISLAEEAPAIEAMVQYT